MGLFEGPCGPVCFPAAWRWAVSPIHCTPSSQSPSPQARTQRNQTIMNIHVWNNKPSHLCPLTWFSQGLCHSRVDLGCFPNFECSFSSPLVKLSNKLLFCLLFCVNLQEWTECLEDDLWDTKLRTNLARLSKYSVHSYLNCLVYFSFVPVHVIHTLIQIIIHIFIKCLGFRRSTFFNSELLS